MGKDSDDQQRTAMTEQDIGANGDAADSEDIQSAGEDIEEEVSGPSNASNNEDAVEENGNDESLNNEQGSQIKKKRKSQSAPDNSAPITNDGSMPKKRFYRQRAHCNPLSYNDSFDYPISPKDIDWTIDHYPNLQSNDDSAPIVPTVLDIGCGFGGLTVALAKILPKEIILGMEIRTKVTEYVRLRILALRKEHSADCVANYENASVMRTNSMKFLPNYFRRGSIQKLFFCFPDPHFKRKNFPRRIVSDRLLSEYAYLLSENNGKLYCITDVKELHDWHIEKCNGHPMFERIPDDSHELLIDPCVEAMKTETEESKKVERNGGNKYYAVYKRISIVDNEDQEFAVKKWHMDNFFDTVEEKENDDVEEKAGDMIQKV